MYKKLAVVVLVALFGLAQAAPVYAQSSAGATKQTTQKKSTSKKQTKKPKKTKTSKTTKSGKSTSAASK